MAEEFEWDFEFHFMYLNIILGTRYKRNKSYPFKAGSVEGTRSIAWQSDCLQFAISKKLTCEWLLDTTLNYDALLTKIDILFM